MGEITMNSIIKTIFLGFMACLSGSTAFGYVVAAHLLVNKSSNQAIVLLSDYHDETQASIAQRISILEAAKQFNAYLLAEDNGYRCEYASPDEVVAYPACFQSFLDALVADPVHFDPNKDYEGDLSILDPTANNETSPLLLLTPMAKAQQIKTKTVECRQAEKISHYNGPISAQQVVAAYDALVSRVARFNDGDQFNAFYAQKLNEYSNRRNWCPNFFRYLEHSQKNLKHAFSESTYESELWNAYKKVQYENYVHEYIAQGADSATAQKLAAQKEVEIEDEMDLGSSFFMYLYNFLIDSTILHEIATHKDEPIIFAYCGAWHAESILPTLRSAGFETEKVWDASNRAGQNALNLDRYFEKICDQLQELSGAENKTINNYAYLDLACGIEEFDQGVLPFGMPCIVI